VTYSESQVNELLEQLLALRNSGPVYNVTVKNGVLRYRSCIPGQHQIVDHHKETYDVTAADDSVMVGVHITTGVTKLFYPHEMGSLSIINKPQPRIETPVPVYGTTQIGDDILPGLGAIYTHHTNSIPYLVLGYANESAREDKRAEYPTLVIYVGQNGKVWAKTVTRFNETMNQGGCFQFHHDAGFKYMGIIENDQIANGWMTKELGEMITQGLSDAISKVTPAKEIGDDSKN
jgi:hypothetical protein